MNTLRSTLILAFFLGFVMPSWAASNEPSDIEIQVKAAYLYKFSAYVEWPPSTFAQADTPITIGVVGTDALVAALNNLKQSLSASSRGIKVKQLKPEEPLAGVQILFIGGVENKELKRLLEGIQSQPVLTVTDFPGALDAGSAINFVPIDDRIRFEVSLAHAERSGLKISARLLSVAHKVETRRQ